MTHVLSEREVLSSPPPPRVNPPMNSVALRFLFGPSAAGRAGRASWLTVLACATLLGWKAWAIWRLNVNWDEFYFLTHVHALLRGDLEIPFQTAYAQAFRWLPWAGQTELAQIHAARIFMFLLLALSVWQIVRLAARWTSPSASLIAALAFLCTLPTQMHGGSFRYDSLLLPFVLGALLLLTRPVISRRAQIAAGILCGVGIAVSVKMALFAPLLLTCVLLAPPPARYSRMRTGVLRCVVTGATTLAVAAVLVGLHLLTLQSPHLESASVFAGRSLTKTILETGFLPGEFYLRRLYRADRIIWIAIGVGLLLALARRRWHLVAMVLSVLPVLFYRNTFPYFYVDMLAPAVILVAVVVDEVQALARHGNPASAREWVTAACSVLLLAHGGSRLPLMSTDEQLGQRVLLDAVHRIFPQPVSYLDRAGMVSTYRKVNLFMSTWGMEEYRAARPTLCGSGAAQAPAAAAGGESRLSRRACVELAAATTRGSRRAATLLPTLLGTDPYRGHEGGISGGRDAGSDAAVSRGISPRIGRARARRRRGACAGRPDQRRRRRKHSDRLPAGASGILKVRLLIAQAGPPPAEAPNIPYIFTRL